MKRIEALTVAKVGWDGAVAFAGLLKLSDLLSSTPLHFDDCMLAIEATIAGEPAATVLE